MDATPPPPQALPPLWPPSRPPGADARALPWGQLCARAAVFVWAVGAAQVFFMGLCAAVSAMFISMPADKLDEVIRQSSQTTQQSDELRQMLQHPGNLVAMAVIAVAFGVVPGLAYVALGFGTRSGKTGQMLAVQLMALVQALLLALAILQGVVGGLLQGQPAQVTMVLLVYGTPLALLAYTAALLLKARAAVLAARRAMPGHGQPGSGIPFPHAGPPVPQPWALPNDLHANNDPRLEPWNQG